MKHKPRVLVLKTDGTNCDEELAFAFSLAGAAPSIVHINELRSKKESLKKYNILGIPGGFSYGDDIVSGKILAIELTSFFANELKQFIDRKDTLTIGICNGFQVLIRTGLLPFRTIGKMDAILTNNDSGHFECRWVNVKVDKNTQCVFLKNLTYSSKESESSRYRRTHTMNDFNTVLSFQVAHGEGKFFCTQETLNHIEQTGGVALRYVDENGTPTQHYPQNPNGSLSAIAGITDATGRILGLMPHPERFVTPYQHPNWRRLSIKTPQGLPLFQNMISYVTHS